MWRGLCGILFHCPDVYGKCLVISGATEILTVRRHVYLGTHALFAITILLLKTRKHTDTSMLKKLHQHQHRHRYHHRRGGGGASECVRTAKVRACPRVPQLRTYDVRNRTPTEKLTPHQSELVPLPLTSFTRYVRNFGGVLVSL